MAITLPWYMAAEPYPTGNTGIQEAVGDGALSSIYNITIGHSITTAFSRRWFAVSGWNAPMIRTVPTGLSMITVGFRFYFDTQWNPGYPFWRLVNGSDSAICELWASAGNALQFRVGGVVKETLSGFQLNTQYFFEISVVVDDTTGSYSIRVFGLDGLTERSASGTDTRGATGNIAAVHWYACGYYNTTPQYFTDLYIKERTLEDPLFHAPIVAKWLKAATDVQEEWTPLSGESNQAMVVDSSGCDSDTTYITTSTLAKRDIYTVDDLPAGVDSVLAVVAVTVSKAPDGGNPLVAAGCRIGSDVDVDAGRVLGQGSYKTQATVYLLQPNGSAWSPTAVNNTELVVDAA